MDSKILLQTESIKKAFGGQIVLNQLDLELHQGEVVLLRGENGSGKTTLLNILTGNLEPDAGTIHYFAGNTHRNCSELQIHRSTIGNPPSNPPKKPIEGHCRAQRFPRPWWRDINPFDHFTPESVTREGVSRTWQDVRLFNAQNLRDNIAVAEPGHPGENPFIALFAPRLAARREKKINQEADAMLARLGLAGRENSSADKISLGQSKRVAIARSVAAGARVLFLDEPLAGLDRQGIGDVLALLYSLVKEEQITLVIVEHIFNQRHLEGLVTTDWLLQDGRIEKTEGSVGWGERSEPQQAPECRQPEVGVRSSPQPKAPTSPGEDTTLPVIPAGNAGTQCQGRLKQGNAGTQCQGWQQKTGKPETIATDGKNTQHPPWFELLTGGGDGVHITDEKLPRGALLTRIQRPGVFPGVSKTQPQPILEIKGLEITRGRRIVIGLGEAAKEENGHAGFDLTLHEGEIAILQAPNGWGKTTLIMAIAGFLPIQQGTIRLQGQPLETFPTWKRVRAGLRVLPSDRFIFPTLNGREAVNLSGAGRDGAGVDSGTFTVEPAALLERKYASLSGGERRQVSIAGFHGGVIGLCDEPFDALDGETIGRAARYLSSATRTLLIAVPYREFS
uniref:ABC-type branched-chain amino acid transport system, ATPase component n=1 Tax=Candidatus Kentrum sp. FW TaxID=2126338 RepID=A0A450U342_9GAMM|nr:MAG: ABC-type branched-chain amino acid transport system, ATPase component [Candidatus Kentron sp. FW]